MQLIVGHTTDQSARIWVRGDPRNPRLTVEIEALGCAEGCADKFTKEIEVGPKGDYTGVADFDELEADKPYVVRVSSAMTRDRLEGRLQTFSAQGAAAPLRFLHGSCNLPTARLAALGSMAVALLGSAATENALDLPWSEWERHRIPRCLTGLLHGGLLLPGQIKRAQVTASVPAHPTTALPLLPHLLHAAFLVIGDECDKRRELCRLEIRRYLRDEPHHQPLAAVAGPAHSFGAALTPAHLARAGLAPFGECRLDGLAL